MSSPQPTPSIDPVATLLGGAPELIHAPGLAADGLNSPNPGVTGQVLSYANTVDQLQTHLKRQSGISGFFHDFTPQWVKDAGGFAATQLNRPLAEVQHEYRYIHDVFENHEIGRASCRERV